MANATSRRLLAGGLAVALGAFALTGAPAFAAAMSAVPTVVSATATATPTPTVTPSATATPTPTLTPTPSPTPTPTPTLKKLTAIGAPKLSGLPSLGHTLTAAAGVWSPAPVTLAYQWLRDGVVIPGATRTTYVPVTADLAKKVSVRVTGSKTGYVTASATSSAVTIGRAYTAYPVPTITGSVAVGRILTAVAGVWGPAPVALTYQWYRGSAPIAGAAASTYKLVAADGGQKVSVRVRGEKTGYTTITRASVAVAVPRVLTVPATVSRSGTPTVGSTLTAVPGTWGPSPVTLSYQWLRAGVAISGATAKTYRLVSADVARQVSVRITGRKTGYTTVVRTSATVDVKWGFTAAPVPTIAGTAAAGQTLTVRTGTWTPAPTLAYQWRIDGAAVAGAKSTSFVVPTWAAGRNVTVSVTASRSGYLTVTKTSVASAVSQSLGSSIVPGTSLRPGVYLRSPNGVYRFTVHADGNVVLSKSGVPLRSTRTTGDLAPVFLFQEDGNLALYAGGGATPVWQSGTTGYAVKELTLDDAGDLRLVEVDGLAGWDSTSLAVWADTSVAGPAVAGRFGWAYPIRPSASMTTYTGHSGDDFAAPTGTPVYAMRGGVVTVQEIWITSGCPAWAPNNSRQKQVLVETVIDGHEFVLTYAHLSAFSVKTGQKVAAGQKIGEVGSTGCSTGPHLHLGIKVDGVAKILYPRDLLGTAKY